MNAVLARDDRGPIVAGILVAKKRGYKGKRVYNNLNEIISFCDSYAISMQNHT